MARKTALTALTTLALIAGVAAAAEPVRYAFAPKPWKRYVITTTVSTKSALTGKNLAQPIRLIDQTTHSLEVFTEPEDFLGGVEGTLQVVGSRGNALTGTMQPIDHETLLSPWIDARLKFRHTADGKFEVRDVLGVPRERAAAARSAIGGLAQKLLYPFDWPAGGAVVGRPFETMEQQELQVENQRIPVDVLRRYTLESDDGSWIVFRTDTVVRPQDPRQSKTAFGRGQGQIVVDRKIGLGREFAEKLHLESSFMSDKGPVTYVSDTETRTFILMDDRTAWEKAVKEGKTPAKSGAPAKP
jgi:hypothetical protein